MFEWIVSSTLTLVSTIVLALCLAMLLTRLNRRIERLPVLKWPHSTLVGKGLPMLNRLGKWLTVFSALATFPLIVNLVIFPETSVYWAIDLGVIGCKALMAAFFILIPVLLGYCFSRQIPIKTLSLSIAQHFFRHIKHFIQRKTIKVWARIGLFFVMVLWIPFFEQLVTGLFYFIGLLMSARLGLLDYTQEDNIDRSWWYTTFNYSTGKWDDGGQPGGMY